MLYETMVDAYQRIEATTKRLEMTDILVELFKATPPELLDKVVYLTQGKLHPDFLGIELGVGEKVSLKAINKATGIPEDKVKEDWIKTGDLGMAAEISLRGKAQQSLFATQLTVETVHEKLDTLARKSGRDSTGDKIGILSGLLHDAKPEEGRYLLRTVNGRLRLGVADMTILDALAVAFATKEDRPYLEGAYNRSSDLGEVARTLIKGGLGELETIKLKLGVPLRSMLAERVPELHMIFDKMEGDLALEYKYDGLRIQAHVGKDGTRLFSRHMEELTDQFPDVVEALSNALLAEETILDGECVPIGRNGEMRPFQEISHRRGRKYDLKKAQEEIPVAFFAFDCLYRDGKNLLEVPYPERREEIAKALKETDRVKISKTLLTSIPEEAETFFAESLGAGCEGIMAKSTAPDSTYKAGARGWQWIKYKRDYTSEMTDTADLVVVGAFIGKGRRAGAYGALLMAAYNQDTDTFETVCKLGTGFDDETLFSLKDRFNEHSKIHSRVTSEMEADYWIVPELVMEVAGAEITLSPIHTCAKNSIREGSGLAIRFPRFTNRWRDDKSPEDATSTDEIVDMYKAQLKQF